MVFYSENGRFFCLLFMFQLFGCISRLEALAYPSTSLDNYIVKWEFYKNCQFGYDPESAYESYPLSLNPGGVTFDPAKVRNGDLIFLRARYIKEFFEKMVPNISKPFIIMAHGEYLDGFRESYYDYLDEPKLIAWFGTHPCPQEHPKFHAIPLGVWPHRPLHSKKEDMIKLFKELRSLPRKKLVYANFADWVHPERLQVKNLFEGASYCTFNSRIPFLDYLKEMAHHKFAFSPRGLGPDCYRTWEALLVGTIPIVRSSYLDHLYKGLPVLIVDEWEDITEEFLERKYEEMAHKDYDVSKLSVDYWLAEVEKIRKSFVRK